jgi:hypothetical protein
MIQKIVEKHRLQERAATQDDFAYWLSKTPEERVATVDTRLLQRRPSLKRAHHSALLTRAGKFCQAML